MKVAYIYYGKSKEQGGGFRFQEEILNCLIKKKNKNYVKYLFYFNYLDEDLLLKSKLSFEKVVFIKESIKDKLFQNLVRNFTFYNERANYRSPIDIWCEKLKIDLVVFIDNSYNYHTNFPYGGIVYDLDHLNYPFFPEFIKNYQWYRRENSLKNFLRKSSFVITGTEIGKKEIISYYGISEKKIFKIAHPTPSYFNEIIINENETSKILKKYKLQKNNYIFYPAQFWPHKNHISYIPLANKIKLQLNNFKIIFSGSDKGNWKYIENHIKKNNLQEIILNLGFINDKELTILYQNATALVYFSFLGPENLPPLEAFKNNCPVIAQKHNGSIEQLAEAAILLDFEDEDKIIQNIIELKNNENFRLNLINKGKKISYFNTVTSFVEKLEAVIFSFKKYFKTWSEV